MYKSCHLILHGLCFFSASIASCCFSPVDHIDGQRPPVIHDSYKGQIFSKDELFSLIHKHSDIFKKGGCPIQCRNCFKIEEKDWDECEYIDQITITHFSNCNFDCIYCSNGCEQSERTNDTYDIIPVLTSFKEQGIIKQGCELHIGGGEFTIYKECDEFLKLFAINNFAGVYIPTNAVKYNENLFRAMDQANTYIIVSLDAGTRKVFKQIKRVDAFDKVLDSLKKYAKTEKSREAIRLKYIIVPSYNDNMGEYKKFLKIAKKLGVRNLIIDLDARYSRLKNYKIDDYFINLAREMNNYAIKKGFITEFYCFFSQNAINKKEKKYNYFLGFIKRMKFKYFDKDLKKLYTDRKYGI